MAYYSKASELEDIARMKSKDSFLHQFIAQEVANWSWREAENENRHESHGCDQRNLNLTTRAPDKHESARPQNVDVAKPLDLVRVGTFDSLRRRRH